MSNATYRITFKSSAAKELGKLDKQTQRRILTAIDALALDPRPSGVKKLRAEFDQYRIRVGHYRVVYEIADGELHILVLRIAHRRHVYRN